MSLQIQSVFFDLDGTLLDTSSDLLYAINQLLAEEGKAPIAMEPFRETIYGGTVTMLKHAFANHPEEELLNGFRQRFLDLYSTRIAEDTDFFPGISELLHYLESKQIPWGIVTNKPGWLTRPLLEQLNITHRCASIVTGDCLPKRKPHPDPIEHACALAHCNPQHAVYVGDTHSDIVAAKAAGLFAVGVRYGFHPRHSPPEDWEADLLIDHPDDLTSWVAKNTSSS